MQSKLLDGHDEAAIAEAAAILKAGYLVAFPTDTVYGLGAKITDRKAIDRLYRAKSRPYDKGIPILIADVDYLPTLAQDIPGEAHQLIKEHWPGPLTIILRGLDNLPTNLSPDNTLALRMPDNEIARRFIRAAGGAVAATSANQSGESPALNAAEVIEALGPDVEAVLDGGQAQIGLASTIVDLTSDSLKIIRQGPIGLEATADDKVKQC
jgi:L-threonylcarbamoyladenylate synthase